MKSDQVVYTYMNSPLGQILLTGNSGHLTSITFQKRLQAKAPQTDWHNDQESFTEAINQLQAYFNGKLHQFDLHLAPQGTSFQLEVWQALQKIPYGQTISYGDLARNVNRPKAARAVGSANGKNSLPIVIPCHRVIGSNGTLTGYAGGIHLKEFLLAHERKCRSKTTS